MASKTETVKVIELTRNDIVGGEASFSYPPAGKKILDRVASLIEEAKRANVGGPEIQGMRMVQMYLLGLLDR